MRGMIRMMAWGLLAALLLAARPGGEEPFWDSPPIRVLVWSATDRVRVEAEEPFVLRMNGSEWTGEGGEEIEIRMNGSRRLQVRRGEETRETDGLHVRARTPAGIFRVGGRRYRGELVIFPEEGGIRAVNRLSVEQYLYGVVAREMGRAELEAQKAQAVVARTYAVARMRARRAAPYDLEASASAQVYGGIPSGGPGEIRQASLAVDDTRGEVLGYRGRLATEPLYHAACGGHTASNEEAFLGTPVPYLRGVVDAGEDGEPLCKGAPSFRWQLRLGREMIEEAARRMGMRGEVRRVEVGAVGPSGRVLELVVTTSLEERKLLGDKIRRFRNLPSTRFTLVNGNDGLEVNGRRPDHPLDGARRQGTDPEGVGPEAVFVEVNGFGSGHGVGMCQWGAMELARRGEEYRAIVRKYYQGTEILEEYGGALQGGF